jgi:hypothetical protein
MDVQATEKPSALNREHPAVFRIRIHFFRIRIQSLRLETNTDPDPIRIQGFNDQKLKKNDS